MTVSLSIKNGVAQNVQNESNNKHDEVLNVHGVNKLFRDNGIIESLVSIKKSCHITDYTTQYVRMFSFKYIPNDQDYPFFVQCIVQVPTPTGIIQEFHSLGFNLIKPCSLVWCPQSLPVFGVKYDFNKDDVDYVDIYFKAPYNNSAPSWHIFMVNPSVPIIPDESSTVYSGSTIPYSVTISIAAP